MSNLLLIALVKKFPSTFPSNIERLKNCGPHILFFPSYFPSLLLFLLTKQVQFLISIQTSLPLFPSFHFSTLPNTLLKLDFGVVLREMCDGGGVEEWSRLMVSVERVEGKRQCCGEEGCGKQ